MKVELVLVPVDEAHAGDLIGWTRAGRPILLPGGGAPDGEDEDEGEEEDEEEDEDEEGDEEEDEDEGDDTSDDWTPPSKQEWQDAQAAKKRANHESQARRRLLEQLGLKFNKQTGDPTDPEYIERLLDAVATLGGRPPANHQRDEDGDGGEGGSGGISQADVDRAVAREVTRAEARAEARYKPALARLALEGALHRAGWSGQSPDMAMRMLDLDEVDVEDGEIVGVDDQVEDLKREFPALFRAVRRGSNGNRRGAEDVDGADKRRRPAPPKRQSWEEQVASRLDGRG